MRLEEGDIVTPGLLIEKMHVLTILLEELIQTCWVLLEGGRELPMMLETNGWIIIVIAQG